MKESTNNYYVYHLIDPKDNLPFYVGKGRGDRMKIHEYEVKNGIIPNDKNYYLFNSLKELSNQNTYPIYKKIKEDLTESDAFILELSEIKKYGRKNNKTGILCNMTDGGEGISGYKHTNQTKKTLSKFFKGKKTWASLHKDEMSLLVKGEKNPFYGKSHSISTKKKIKESLKRTFKKFGHPLKGKSKSEEHKNKISKSQIGKIVSVKTRDKMSKTRLKKYSVDNVFLEKIIELRNIGCGCKKILKELKQIGFPYSITVIKRELKKYENKIFIREV